MQATSASKRTMAGLGDLVTSNGQGFLVAAVVAVAAQFLSDHYGAPAMLMALLLGIAFHFLSEEGACKPGIDFTARTVLRFGVALLGARISVELIVGLGPQLIFVVIAAVILTLLFGLVAARLLGRGWRFGLLTGGSVAICGASAATRTRAGSCGRTRWRLPPDVSSSWPIRMIEMANCTPAKTMPLKNHIRNSAR